MASQTFEVVCDAPPYCVVKVCHLIGIDRPADVRWTRLCHHKAAMERVAERWFGGELASAWARADSPNHCACGHKVPHLEMYTFTFSTGEETSYLLGQCRRCRTVYWEEA
jgi:hypothetical protein